MLPGAAVGLLGVALGLELAGVVPAPELGLWLPMLAAPP